MNIENIHIYDFTMDHYEKARVLWQNEDGIGLSSSDEKENVEQFLIKNPGLSKVLIEGEELKGTILCGHDGRRGYIYHLYVYKGLRGKGLGRELVNACLSKLSENGIHKCHIFIFKSNSIGKRFWESSKWVEREDIEVFSRDC